MPTILTSICVTSFFPLFDPTEAEHSVFAVCSTFFNSLVSSAKVFDSNDEETGSDADETNQAYLDLYDPDLEDDDECKEEGDKEEDTEDEEEDEVFEQYLFGEIE